MKTKPNYFAIAIFYVIAITLRYLTNKTDLLDVVPNAFLKAILTGIGPTVGAIVAFAIFKIKPALSLKGNYRKLLVPFLLFWIFPIVLIPTVEYLSKGTISFAAVTAILVYGLLEEIGWRGFLQHELRALPRLANMLIVAVLWFVWHLNFELTASNVVFFGVLVLGTWGISKVAATTHSLLAVSAFHSLNNFFHELDATKTAILVTLLAVWIGSLVIRKKLFARHIQPETGQIV
ncbi:CPBP family intramembrane glutamic endopeptidase [Flavobacterium sp.]|uniref:CPBP family intramembrane glutamic endopeptidase n=1 Tax=Flavobacterium sp. TaxID=239 RepID=UPI001205D032|nr:CPBP family intramembrane glutamic endopeptidase [Flavobacterium sp.]RZJ71188.1 MAG: CPBP family intramembrane metalloprotease [Flavobacterium sp.]